MIQSMEFPRYVLIAFVGMFALAGFGAGCVRSTVVRILLAVMIVHYSVPPLRNWLQGFARRRLGRSDRIGRSERTQ